MQWLVVLVCAAAVSAESPLQENKHGSSLKHEFDNAMTVLNKTQNGTSWMSRMPETTRRFLFYLFKIKHQIFKTIINRAKEWHGKITTTTESFEYYSDEEVTTRPYHDGQRHEDYKGQHNQFNNNNDFDVQDDISWSSQVQKSSKNRTINNKNGRPNNSHRPKYRGDIQSIHNSLKKKEAAEKKARNPRNRGRYLSQPLKAMLGRASTAPPAPRARAPPPAH